jgi:hypothetical protein
VNEAGEEELSIGTHHAASICTGTAAKPTAPSGNLCIYVGSLSHAETGSEFILPPAGGENGAGTSGAIQEFLLGTGEALGHGTWAVTG